jgi:hypothetical protein
LAQPSTLMNRSAMSSDMETLLLVRGGTVEGMTSHRNRNSSARPAP